MRASPALSSPLRPTAARCSRRPGSSTCSTTIVDGTVARSERLAGKPAPDTFLAGAKGLGLEAAACVVYEDALAGVEAGRAGNFGLVVGVDRADQAAALAEHGADVVVDDLGELIER